MELNMLVTMNYRAALAALAFATGLAGCSSPKDFYATGGSRADGVVDVAYDFNRMETPVVDKKQAYSIAKTKCSLWGYSDAEPFGGQVQTCEARSGFGECSAFKVSIKYQCLGSLERAPAPANYMGPTSIPTPTQRSAPVGVVPATTTPPPLTQQEYREAQIQLLMQQNISYEEYQKRYRAIVGE